MNKTLSVSAIQNGTVIDHVPAGQALRIIQLLRLLNKKYRITVGFNLSSQRMKLKDLIKIENHVLTNQEANEVTVFAPDVTINIIKNFEVAEKINASVPETIAGIFACPNPACITNNEAVETFFRIEEVGKSIQIQCKFCEKTFDRNDVKQVKI